MKKYILPIVLVLIGSVLLVSYKIVSDDPSLNASNAACSQADTGCTNASSSTLATASAYGALVGAISIPAGVVVGVYRLVAKKHV